MLDYVRGHIKPIRFCNYFLEVIGAFGVATVREYLSDQLQEISCGKIIQVHKFADTVISNSGGDARLIEGESGCLPSGRLAPMIRAQC